MNQHRGVAPVGGTAADGPAGGGASGAAGALPLLPIPPQRSSWTARFSIPLFPPQADAGLQPPAAPAVPQPPTWSESYSIPLSALLADVGAGQHPVPDSMAHPCACRPAAGRVALLRGGTPPRQSAAGTAAPHRVRWSRQRCSRRLQGDPAALMSGPPRLPPMSSRRWPRTTRGRAPRTHTRELLRRAAARRRGRPRATARPWTARRRRRGRGCPRAAPRLLRRGPRRARLSWLSLHRCPARFARCGRTRSPAQPQRQPLHRRRWAGAGGLGLSRPAAPRHGFPAASTRALTPPPCHRGRPRWAPPAARRGGPRQRRAGRRCRRRVRCRRPARQRARRLHRRALSRRRWAAAAAATRSWRAAPGSAFGGRVG